MDEFKVRKPKVAPSPDVRKVDERPAKPVYEGAKGNKPPSDKAHWIQEIEKASGRTAEQLQKAIRAARKKE